MQVFCDPPPLIVPSSQQIACEFTYHLLGAARAIHGRTEQQDRHGECNEEKL